MNAVLDLDQPGLGARRQNYMGTGGGESLGSGGPDAARRASDEDELVGEKKAQIIRSDSIDNWSGTSISS